ncbi:MAG: S8 family serine peptidase [Gammaproteobacteria bacterium]
MIMTNCARLLRSIVAFTALCVGTSTLADGPAGKLDADLASALTQGLSGRIEVMVALSPVAFDQRATTLAGRVNAVSEATNRVLRALPAQSYEVKRRWHAVAGMVLYIDAAELETLAAQPEVLRIGNDLGAGSGNLVESLPLVGFDTVLNDLGITGAGTTIAVLDSGHDTDHPDIGNALVGERCFAEGGAACPGGVNDAEDDFGHGTAVAGVITSDGSVAPMGGAIDADIFAVKVLDSNNSFTSTQWVVDGLDFVINSGIDFDAVNMSLGTFASFAGDCDTAASFTILLADAVDALRDLGIVSIVSTGNQGNFNAMQAPACVAGAISVGASNDGGDRLFDPFGCGTGIAPADSVSCFTNASATTDIFAPGAEITTAFNNGGFAFWHGTSFSAPTVAACVASLREADPSLTPDQIEAAMESTATATVTAGARTFPRLDCAAAVASVLTGTDTDGDGIGDGADNCTLLANASQTDSNGDGIGNACDPDLNNDCVVNVIDLGILRTVFFTNDADADFNGDGTVNVGDLGRLRSFFFAAPGPGAAGNDCSG